MSREVELRIAAVAARQHGVVTYRQLIEAGVSRAAVARRARSGRMRALHRGVYLVVPMDLPHSSELAAVLASGPGATLSHLNALALWELHRRPDGGPIDVTADGHRGRHPGIRVHRVDLPPVDRTIKHGIPVTTPARTLLDVASELPLRDLEAAVARAEREGLVTREQLFALLKRNVGRRGARALRAVLRIAGGPALTRSEAEERFLALVREADLPPPECNAKVGAYEIDFLWRRQAIAVEVDGYLYHSGRTRFDGDRRRDARLLAQGITVLRLSWRQITQEAVATGAQLAVALCRAESR